MDELGISAGLQDRVAQVLRLWSSIALLCSIALVALHCACGVALRLWCSVAPVVWHCAWDECTVVLPRDALREFEGCFPHFVTCPSFSAATAAAVFS